MATRKLEIEFVGDTADLEKAFKKVSARLKTLETQNKRTADSTSDVESRFSHLDNTLGDFNRTMTATANVVKLVKFPALIAGAGMAAQAVGALSAGAIGLAGALAPLSGVGAAYAAGLVAIAQGAGVAKLATAGLSDALSGQKGAMAKLSPVQRGFVKDLRAVKQETRGLRGEAQRGLLPGLDTALNTVTPLLARLKPIVGDTAKTMGGLAVAGARTVRSWGPDISKVGETNVRVIRNLGMAAIAAADGARHLVVAAGPLLTWMSRLARVGAEWADSQIAAGRESGRLAAFLGRTRAVMSTLGHIAGNLAVAFFDIGKAAAPLGRDLLADIEKLTKKFRDWTASATGRNTLDDYFRSAREPIKQVAGLVGDVGAAFLRLSQSGTQSTSLIVKLRSLVPIFENVVASTTAAFGPALIDALGNVLRLFGQLAGSSGPLVSTVRLIGLIAGALADLLSSNPALNSAVVSFIGFYGVVKAMSFVFGPLVTAAKAFEAALLGETAAANIATGATLRQRGALVATAVAMYATQAATKLWTAAQWLLNAALTANPIGLIVVGLAALGAALVLAYTKSKTFRDIVNGAFNTIKSVAQTVFPVIKKMAEFGLLGPIPLIIARWNTFKTFISGAWGTIKSGASSFASGIRDVIVGAFQGAANSVIDFVNAIIKAINAIPGVPNVKLVGRVGGGGGSSSTFANPKGTATTGSRGDSGLARGGAFGMTGGMVNQPMVMMGEEAPRHPEFVIPTNPAYRGRAKGLLSQAAGAIGYAKGGVLGDLPKASSLPGWITGLGSYLLKHVGDWVKDKLADFVGGSAKPGSVGPGGTVGGGAVGGLVAQVLRALAWARGHGWGGTVISGFRSYAEQAALYARYLAGGNLAAPPGRSSHESGQAVDVTDPAGFARALANAPAGSRIYNRLGAADPPHFSVSGYAKGGVVGGKRMPYVGAFKNGGYVPQTGMAMVHKGEGIFPMATGGIASKSAFNSASHFAPVKKGGPSKLLPVYGIDNGSVVIKSWQIAGQTATVAGADDGLTTSVDGTPFSQSDIDELNGTIGDLNDTITRQNELLELQTQRNDALQRTANVQQVDIEAIKAWLAEVVSGKQGGRVGLGFTTVSAPGVLAKP